MKFVYVTYYTYSEAISTEYVCKNKKVKGKLVSVPRELSAGCGIAFETNIDNFDKIKKILIENGIEYQNISILKK